MQTTASPDHCEASGPPRAAVVQRAATDLEAEAAALEAEEAVEAATDALDALLLAKEIDLLGDAFVEDGVMVDERKVFQRVSYEVIRSMLAKVKSSRGIFYSKGTHIKGDGMMKAL